MIHTINIKMCKHSQKTALTLPFCQFFSTFGSSEYQMGYPKTITALAVACFRQGMHWGAASWKKVLLSSQSCKTISWNPRIKKMTLETMEMNNSFKHCPHIKQITYCVVSSWEEIQIPRGCVRKGIQHKNLPNPIRRVTCCGGPLRISEQPKVASFFGHYKLIFGC